MKAVIATNNKVKIESAKRALLHYFEDVEVIGINISSEVSEQPINEEIYKGVKNRISNLKKYCKENEVCEDLYLAIESGISNQLGEWQVLSMALIENNKGIQSFSVSSSFPIPERYIKDIVNNDVESVMKDIFGDNTMQKGVQLLTKGAFSRSDLIEEAFVMGMIKFVHGEKWC